MWFNIIVPLFDPVQLFYELKILIFTGEEFSYHIFVGINFRPQTDLLNNLNLA